LIGFYGNISFIEFDGIRIINLKALIMKKLILNLIIIITISFAISSKLNAQINKTFIGKWSFECLLAPAGFNEGIIEIKTDSVFTQYAGRDCRFSSVWVKMKNDTLIFKVDINGERVVCRLLPVEGNKLAGIADTMEDESPLILTKKEDVPYYFALD
jgi:hypothetical protein